MRMRLGYTCTKFHTVLSSKDEHRVEPKLDEIYHYTTLALRIAIKTEFGLTENNVGNQKFLRFDTVAQ